MRFTTVILGLVAAASAIDIRIHDGQNCDGGSWQCFNWAPNTCCSAPVDPAHKSIGFYGIPVEWQFVARGYLAQNCARGETAHEEVFGTNFVCLRTGASFGSAGYGFWGKKKAAADTCTANDPATGQKCLEEKTANSLVLADGTQYLIEGVAEDLINELAAYTFNGTSHADIPEKFQQYEF